MVYLEDESSNTGKRGFAQETLFKDVCKSNLSTADSCNATPEFIFPVGVLGIGLRFQSLEALTHFNRAWPFSNGKSRKEKDVSLASRANEGITTVVPSPIKKARKPTISALKIATLLISISLLLLMAPPCDARVPCDAGVRCKETKQKLSKECWDMLQHNTCPNQEQDPALYRQLQELCCNSSHIVKFHCQLYEEKGIDVLFPACLPEETCRPGFSCRIAEGSDGSPHIVQENCRKGLFASEHRFSFLEIKPYCTDSHTQCTNVGLTEFCQGDTINDTRCMCKDGFSQICSESDNMMAFTQHSTCVCNSSNVTYCPVWKHPLIPVPFCSSLLSEQLLINTTNCPEPNKPPIASSKNSTAFGTTSKTSTAFGTTEQPATTGLPDTEINKSTARLIAVITVALIIVTVATVVAVILFRAKIKTVLGRIRDHVCAHASYNIPADQDHSESQV